MTPAEDDTIRNTINRSRRLGRDIVDDLDTAKLLLTEETKHQVTMEALRTLREDLRKWSAVEYLRRIHKDQASTPQDMYRAILGYVDDYLNLAGAKSVSN